MQWKYIGESLQKQLSGNLGRHEMSRKQQSFCTSYRSWKYLLFLGTVDCLCIQLLDQLEVLKSFSWKCILRLRSSVSSLKIISTYCDLGTRDRSLGLFFPCSCLPIFFLSIYRNFDIFSDSSLVLQVSWHSKEDFTQDDSKNQKRYVSISFGSWFLSERRLKARTNYRG